MRIAAFIVLLSLLVGCSGPTTETTTASSESESAASTSAETPSSDADAPGEETQEVSLTPANTHIQFVGTHVGPVPDPNARVGTFQDFQGTAHLSGGQLVSIAVEIQMASVSTPMDKLTNHLQAPDFFDVRSYPTATFESTSIATDDNGTHMIVGNLTLHGETHQIELKGTAEVNDGEVDLMVEVELDRTQFGMDQNLDKVNKEVPLTIGVGKFVESLTAEDSP